jgi:uncharacterized protein YqgC (DUF456 family)
MTPMDPMMQTLFGILAVLLVLGGLAGAILPILPGLPMVFGGLLLAAWVDGFEHVGKITIGILVVLLLVGLAMDFISGSFGAKRVGASPKAVLGATLGSIVGIFFGLPGLILGPFIGAVIGELGARRGLDQAAASGFATWIGLLLGSIAKLALGLAMIGVFAFVWFV